MIDPKVVGAHGRRLRLSKNLTSGIVFHTDHTGLGTAEIAAKAFEARCIRELYKVPGAMRLQRGCGIKPSSQGLMLGSGREGPDHVHADVLSALKPEMLARLQAMEPMESWPTDRKRHAYKAMHSVIETAFKNKTLFNDNGGVGWCM